MRQPEQLGEWFRKRESENAKVEVTHWPSSQIGEDKPTPVTRVGVIEKRGVNKQTSEGYVVLNCGQDENGKTKYRTIAFGTVSEVKKLN